MRTVLTILILTVFQNQYTFSQQFDVFVDTTIDDVTLVHIDEYEKKPWGVDMEIQYEFFGDCDYHITQRLPVQQHYDIELPPDFREGFSVSKIKWYRPTGYQFWTKSWGLCHRLYTPAKTTKTTDTVIVQQPAPIIQSHPQQPDWAYTVMNLSKIEVIQKPAAPSGTKIEQIFIVSAAGYIVQNSNLPGGMYLVYITYDFQGMKFFEIEAIAI